MDRAVALRVVNNWRACHAFPLNTLQVRLRGLAKDVDANYTVAQRIKRLPAIESKLRRLRSVTLSTMQDLGGCRAVVTDNETAYELYQRFRTGRARHIEERFQDKVEAPDSYGYRSRHLIYQYRSENNSIHDGERIEVQIRSRLQHAWATALETVDTFLGQALKIHQGEDKWERFFALMGTVIARREDTPRVPGTPDAVRPLVSNLRALARELNVDDRLRAVRATIDLVRLAPKNVRYFLLDLDKSAQTVAITPYTARRAAEASTHMAELEEEYRLRDDRDVLLASAMSMGELRRAFPNYEADTDLFLQELKDRLLR
jgi:hypothetical protein